MKVLFAERAWEGYLYWQQADRKALKRINALIRDIQRRPFQGIGKPEPLRGNWTGFWSRRIDREHRLVYAIDGNRILVAQCCYHY